MTEVTATEATLSQNQIECSPETIAAQTWGKVVNGEVDYPLHQGQWDILYTGDPESDPPKPNPARFKLACAGTGGGKTALGPLWLYQQMVRKPGGLWLIVAPTYGIMARATAPTFITMFAKTDLRGHYKESRNRYYLPDGGIVWFLSSDRPTALEGGQADGIWIDEGGQLKRGAWTALQGRSGLNQAPILITTTPYGMNWLYSEFYKRWLNGDKDYYVRQWSSCDNPAYSQAEYDRMKRTLSPQRAAMRYDGQFVRMAGLVYPEIESCFCEPFAPPAGRLVGGIDWGWTNPFCALSAVYYVEDDGKDTIYIAAERYKRNTSMGDHAARLPRGLMWYADPSRPESIAELRRAGLKCKGARNDIMLGIDAVSSRINTGRLKISNVCRALKAETEEYRYPEKDEEVFGEKPIDDFNHACDALRYLVMGIDHRKVAKAYGKAS